MDFDNFSKTSKDRYSELEMSRTWPLLMRKVYTWMAMALAITGVVAYGVGTSEAMLMMLYNGMAPLLICIFAELGIVFYLSSRIQKLSLAAATTWFIIFSVLNGLTLGWIFAAYTAASIAKTFFITAGNIRCNGYCGHHYKERFNQDGRHFVHGTHWFNHCRLGKYLLPQHYV